MSYVGSWPLYWYKCLPNAVSQALGVCLVDTSPGALSSCRVESLGTAPGPSPQKAAGVQVSPTDGPLFAGMHPQVYFESSPGICRSRAPYRALGAHPGVYPVGSQYLWSGTWQG